MKKIQFYPVSWEDLQKGCFELTKKLLKSGLKFNRIICIARGGMVVARIVGDFLKLPISNFTIVSYRCIGKQTKPKVVEKLRVNIEDEKILLIDEIVDKGTTLKKARDYLQKFKPVSTKTLSLFIKPWSNPVPDFWQIKTNKWVVFPYEVRETIEDVSTIWQKEGLTKNKIEKQLQKLGFSREVINQFH